MANENNLIPLNKRPKEERKEIQKKGGHARAEQRKRMKTYREIAEAVLPLKIQNDEIIALLRSFGIEGDIDLKTATLLGVIKASIEGNPKAFDKLLELTGESGSNNGNGKLEELIGGLQRDE